jgi:hypothetical protein
MDPKVLALERLTKSQPLAVGCRRNPGLWVRTRRRGRSGTSCSATIHPDRPSEALTREQAVIASTLTAAYAEFAETEKGSLVPGKLADLAVISQDIFSVPPPELPKTESVLTLVGGQVVYDAKVLPASER